MDGWMNERMIVSERVRKRVVAAVRGGTRPNDADVIGMTIIFFFVSRTCNVVGIVLDKVGAKAVTLKNGAYVTANTRPSARDFRVVVVMVVDQ